MGQFFREILHVDKQSVSVKNLSLHVRIFPEDISLKTED